MECRPLKLSPLWVLVVVLLIGAGRSARGDEDDETERLAAKYYARDQVVLSDQTRVDLLSEDWAIEVEYARVWKSSIGQAVHYSIVANRDYPEGKRAPAVLLLIQDPVRDRKYVIQCGRVCRRLGINLFWELVGDVPP